MKVSAAACFLLASSATAFAPSRPAFSAPTLLRMTEEVEAPPASAPVAAKADVGGALVPIKEETVEFTAGILGGAFGFAVGGPLFGVIAAAAANYVSKMDGDVSDVVQAVSKTSIQVFNYLATLDKKYEVLKKAQGSLENALDNLKKQESVDPATIEKVEKALANTNKKIKEVNDEYDLVGGGVTALGVVGDLVEKIVDKAGELNKEYQLTEKAKESLNSAIAKAKAAAKEAS